MQNLQINTFQLLTPNLPNNLLEQMFRLRHKGFIQEEKYEVNDYNGIDFDQYDNPYAHYLTISQNGKVVACARFNKTDFNQTYYTMQENGTKNYVSVSFMAKDQWSNVIPKPLLENLPPNTWELTRFYVDSSIETKDRAKLSRILFEEIYMTANKIGVLNLLFITHEEVITGIEKLGFKVNIKHEVQIPNFCDVFLAHCPI